MVYRGELGSAGNPLKHTAIEAAAPLKAKSELAPGPSASPETDHLETHPSHHGCLCFSLCDLDMFCNPLLVT